MFDAPQVFVDIDTQRDFLEPGGALAIAGAAAIVPNLERLSRFARERGIPVLATACAHSPDDPELERFPPHCLIGTPGQERVEATRCPESLVLTDADPAPEALPRHVTLWKREIDAFTTVHADRLIRRLAEGGPLFVVYGVATDYCVGAAVEGLLARGCRVALVADAIRAIDPSAEADLLSSFARRGVLLTTTDVVCDPSGRLAPSGDVPASGRPA